MINMGIKEIAGQVGKFAETKLMGREGCVTFIDNEIVLCVENEPGYLATGVRFDAEAPRMILMTATTIINRLVFDLSPIEASAIISSTIPKAKVHRRNKQQKKQQLAYSN
jgi:hypothetical protein